LGYGFDSVQDFYCNVLDRLKPPQAHSRVNSIRRADRKPYRRAHAHARKGLFPKMGFADLIRHSEGIITQS